MKKALMLTALVVLFAVPAMAAIKNTKHNLGTTGDYAYRVTDANGTTQICIFCHTPHNAVKPVPLWNRSNPAASGFKMYTASPSLNLVKANLTDDSVSLFCLSCHDGGPLGGRVQNDDGTKVMTTKDPGGAAAADYLSTGAKGNLGTDLTNDHPVNMKWSVVVADPDIKATAPTQLRYFKTSGGGGKAAGTDYVECATCHDVHGAGYTKFLRRSNDSSSLCLTCHQK